MQTRADTCFCIEQYSTSFEHKDHCNPKFYKQFTTVPISITYERNWQTLVIHTKSEMTLNVIYNNPDHNDKAVFYAACHDITQYIFVANLKMEIGIKNTDLRILST